MKSLKYNAFLNGLKTILNMLFPIITFPYVSKVLQVEKLGEYNFSFTFINYFILIAGLGINSYAIREGSKLKENKNRLERFISEVFTINILSTILSYILLMIVLKSATFVHKYTYLILIFSIQLIFITIGVEWLYSIFEEYSYTTILNIIFKILSIILLFLFVKTQNDVYNYALITVFATVGSNIFYFLNSRKYCRIKICNPIAAIKKHIKPILILFASNLAVMIYVYSDTTMLGILNGDYSVGIYTVSTKIYMIIKQLLSSILFVSIPRVSMLYACSDKTKFINIVKKVYDNLMILVWPTMIGLFMLSDRIILFISDSSYIGATSSLRILSIALLACFVGWIFNQCVLLPAAKEKIILYSTLISATVNIILNIILMPTLAENAAAITTLLSESIMMIICYKYGKKICPIKLIDKNMFSILVGCISIIFTCYICNNLFISFNNISIIIICITLSVIVYIAILLLLKNSILITELKKVINFAYRK